MSVHANILAIGLGLFSCGLCLHVFLWRIRHPQNHLGALLVVFLTPVLFFLLGVFLLRISFSSLDLFAIILLHISLSCAYIQMYPACQADSPSLHLLTKIGKAPSGMTPEMLQACFDPQELFNARLRDLLDSRLIRQADQRLILTAKGRAFVFPFVFLRKILGLPEGRG